MITFEYLLTSLVVILIPGAGVLYTLAIGLASGKRASVFATLGCTMGITPSLLASAFGLAAIFHASSLAFQIVKYAGVVYLLFLAWQIWRSAPPALTKQPKPAISLYAVAAKGFFINTLNPKLSIFFLAFLPQFIAPDAAQPLIDMLLLGLVFMVMTFAVFSVYGLMASSFSQLVARSTKLSLIVQRTFAGSFAALGVKLALTEPA